MCVSGKSDAIFLTRPPSIIGRENGDSRGHRCSIHSGTSACDGSVKTSLTCSCTMSVPPCRCSTCSVLPVSSTPSKNGALVFGGGPFRSDGAPNCVASLHRRISCFRLIFCRALCSAMERVFRFTGTFSRLRSKHYLRISIIASSCGSRYDFLFFAEPNFPAACAIAFVTALKSGVCSGKLGSLLGKSTAPVHRIRRTCSHDTLSL